MYKFIWHGKPDKIKRDILIQDYGKVILKMIDIKTFIKALKISWIKRITQTSETSMLSQIYLSKLKKYGGKLLFECNLSKSDAENLNITNNFFKEILIEWCIEHSRSTICNCGNEVLWNNTNIKTDNNTIFYSDWHNKGIIYMKDIVNITDKSILDFTSLKAKYDLPNSDFIKYLTLLHSIPNTWKTMIKQEPLDMPMKPTLISQIVKTKQTNRYIYQYILNKQTPNNKAEQKWNTKFDNGNLNWKRIYTNTMTATKDIKFINFQYKYIMRIIPINKFLLKCNIADSALCKFCNIEIETTDHLFWQCIHIQTFWAKFSDFLTEHNIEAHLTLYTVSFGLIFSIGKSEIKLKNFLILLGKYFIYRGKCTKTIPTIIQFKTYLRNRIKLEKEIYFIKDKLAQFEQIRRNFENFQLNKFKKPALVQ